MYIDDEMVDSVNLYSPQKGTKKAIINNIPAIKTVSGVYAPDQTQTFKAVSKYIKDYRSTGYGINVDNITIGLMDTVCTP